MSIASFEELAIWQSANRLAVEVYRVTEGFPKREVYSLTDQVRRSASSVSGNIAEGAGRYSTKEVIRFLCVARGSLNETKSHLILAKDIGYIDKSSADAIINKYAGLSAGINSFISKLRQRL